MSVSQSPDTCVLPTLEALSTGRSKLIKAIPEDGIGVEAIKRHLEHDIAPALNRQSQSPNFYGFVTGGATPAARYADHFVVDHDQSLQVHLPDQTLCTDVEDAALRMLCDMLDLDATVWAHRTFTTGATASNVLGLACGREYLLSGTAEHGVAPSMSLAGVEEVQILTTAAHSSLRKAASIVGLGRTCVQDVGLYQAKHNFDFHALEAALQRPKTASIIVVSCAEVNTGFFATSGNDMSTLRQLADKYNAWIHVDAAFGLPARVLDPEDPITRAIADGVKDLQLADSITGDAHKLLNVPYDCGIFLSRYFEFGTQVFSNTGAAYLSPTDMTHTIPSPLNIGIENSRRFRALPVYATLAAYGRQGHREMLQRQISLARAIAQFISDEPGLELLPRTPTSFDKPKEQGHSRIYIVVLFRASDDALNKELVQRINATRRVYISGTQWEGQPAARFAVSNWQVNVERDMVLIRAVFSSVLKR